MKPSELLELHRDEIREIVAAHGHSNPRVFGSVARGEDDEISDIDFLIDLAPHASLFDLSELYYELNKLLGVEIDVLVDGAIPERLRDQVHEEAIAV
jgi:uncharacterized protein